MRRSNTLAQGIAVTGASQATGRVLIVDDDPGMRALLADELRYRGYSVTVARNGGEALERVDMMSPDVIVLDLMMPVMDGWTFAEYLRDHARRPLVPIIAMSAEGDLRPGYKALGVAAFLRKPFDLHELASSIAQVTLVRQASAAPPSRTCEPGQ